MREVTWLMRLGLLAVVCFHAQLALAQQTLPGSLSTLDCSRWQEQSADGERSGPSPLLCQVDDIGDIGEPVPAARTDVVSTQDTRWPEDEAQLLSGLVWNRHSFFKWC